MTVNPDLPHKASQIRHDLDDLYELVSQVEKSQTRMAGVLKVHGERLEDLQQTLDVHSVRLDRLEENQRQMLQTQNQMQDTQREQFEYLSSQIAEILSVLRRPSG